MNYNLDNNTNFTKEISIDKDRTEVLRIPLQEFEIYKLDFEVNGKSSGYWFADFYNSAGEQNYADNYSSTYESPDDFIHQSALFMARSEAVQGIVGFQAINNPLHLRNIKINSISKSEALDWMDALYASLPQINPVLDQDRCSLLPQTKNTLQHGGHIQMVALGDSISNDMINGLGHLLVEREYPGVTIQPIHANGPEKSSTNYQYEEVMQRLVIRHQPDLFIVSGMSHEPESVRTLIDIVRNAGNDVETIYFDVRVDGDPNPTQRLDQLAKMKEIGAKDGFAVWDMTSQFEDCMCRTALSAEWFRRDAHHVNDRGKQLLARLFASYFIL